MIYDKNNKYLRSFIINHKNTINTIYLVISSLYVCMAIKYIIVLFVETPRKFINKWNKLDWVRMTFW
jgi:hypothetical protein